MHLDHDFFLSKQIKQRSKKRFSPKIEEFFSPNSSEDQNLLQTSSSAHMQTWVKLLGGMHYADADHCQIIGGNAVKLLGDMSPRVSASLGPGL